MSAAWRWETFDYSKNGGIIGGHIGYNWQYNWLVVGLEGSIAKPWVDADEVVSPFFPDTDRFSSKVNWIATVTPRIGYAAGNFLVYAKGGWAHAGAKDQVGLPAVALNICSRRIGFLALNTITMTSARKTLIYRQRTFLVGPLPPAPITTLAL